MIFPNLYSKEKVKGPKYKQRDKKAKAETRRQKQARRINRKIKKT